MSNTAKYITWERFIEIFRNDSYKITYEGMEVTGDELDKNSHVIQMEWEEDGQLFEYKFHKEFNLDIVTLDNKIILMPEGGIGGADKFVFEVFELKPASF